jgi:hypothetical protein
MLEDEHANRSHPAALLRLRLRAARLSGRSGAALPRACSLLLSAPPDDSVCLSVGSKHAVWKEGMGRGLPNPRQGSPRVEGSLLLRRLPGSGGASGNHEVQF